MSEGIRPYDFVQQVYYAQEKVILDFWPDDDKYKEVLFEANMVLQELQNVEDWTWLRDQLELGPCWHHRNEIPEFDLPSWVYKPSTLNHDTVKLHFPSPLRHGGYDRYHFIPVPLVSAGDNRKINDIAVDGLSNVHIPDLRLKAVRIGDTITFNRPLTPRESGCIAVLDVQRRITQFHICNEFCKGVDPESPIDYSLDENGEWVNPCAKIEKRALCEIPDPNYVVMATAARHAEGSPPALARVAGLQDAAQKILSAMRQNDAAATEADYQDWDIPGYVEVI